MVGMEGSKKLFAKGTVAPADAIPAVCPTYLMTQVKNAYGVSTSPIQKDIATKIRDVIHTYTTSSPIFTDPPPQEVLDALATACFASMKHHCSKWYYENRGRLLKMLPELLELFKAMVRAHAAADSSAHHFPSHTTSSRMPTPPPPKTPTPPTDVNPTPPPATNGDGRPIPRHPSGMPSQSFQRKGRTVSTDKKQEIDHSDAQRKRSIFVYLLVQLTGVLALEESGSKVFLKRRGIQLFSEALSVVKDSDSRSLLLLTCSNMCAEGVDNHYSGTNKQRYQLFKYGLVNKAMEIIKHRHSLQPSEVKQAMRVVIASALTEKPKNVQHPHHLHDAQQAAGAVQSPLSNASSSPKSPYSPGTVPSTPHSEISMTSISTTNTDAIRVKESGKPTEILARDVVDNCMAMCSELTAGNADSLRMFTLTTWILQNWSYRMCPRYLLLPHVAVLSKFIVLPASSFGFTEPELYESKKHIACAINNVYMDHSLEAKKELQKDVLNAVKRYADVRKVGTVTACSIM